MKCSQSWRVAFEASASLKVLRVFLSRNETNPAERCRIANAQLLATRPPSLLCDWQTDLGQKLSLHVALPLCLVDQSAPVSVLVRTDHLELKLKLLSVNETLLTLLKDNVAVKHLESNGPLCLESDARLLASEEAVVVRCKSCSASLMRTPLRKFLELPSVDWQELSDNWYGGCCCEDKARSRSSVLRCGGSLIPPAGTCLVGPSFCVVDGSDALGDVALKGLSQFREQSLGSEEVTHGPTSDSGSGCNTIHPQADQPWHGDAGLDEKDVASCDEVSYSDDRDDDVRHSHHCLATNLWADPPQHPAWKGREALGKAMAVQPLPGKCGWTRFLCHSCSSLVGEVSELQQHGNPVHELRFLKYHISTDKDVGSRGDLFRRHTVQRVVANQILSRVEGDATYRFIVRDRHARTPLLQLVVLNQEQWICVQTEDLHPEMVGGDNEKRMGGNCFVGHGWDTAPDHLQPVIKIRFRDCSSLTGNDIKTVEDWARLQQAEDMYLWGEDAIGLIETLNQTSAHFPRSCQCFEQFVVSYMEK